MLYVSDVGVSWLTVHSQTSAEKGFSVEYIEGNCSTEEGKKRRVGGGSGEWCVSLYQGDFRVVPLTSVCLSV